MAHNSSLEAQAEKLRLLAHPAKLMIIQLLRQDGAMTRDEILSATNLTKEKIRQYLTSMEAINVIKSRKKDTLVYYYIEDCELMKLIERM